MNAIVKADPHQLMGEVLIKGDLSSLSAQEKNNYYKAVCESTGLNPLTKPFEFIVLNGKMRLYALKDCTDQLRSIHGISVVELVESEREGVFIVKAKVANAQGRTDVSTGAVNIANMKGEMLANALMKAETKAKRRATLSICGLGLLDETEVDDIPASQRAPVPSPTTVTAIPQMIKTSSLPPAAIVQPSKPEDGPHRIIGGTFATWTQAYIEAVQSAGEASVVYAWVDANAPQLEKLAKGSPAYAQSARAETEKHLAFLRKTDPKSEDTTDAFPGDLPMESPAAEQQTPRRGRPPKPNMDRDYDGWVNHYLKKISECKSVDDIDEIFAAIDGEWNRIMPPDREHLMGARRETEAKMEP